MPGEDGSKGYQGPKVNIATVEQLYNVLFQGQAGSIGRRGAMGKKGAKVKFSNH